MTTEPFLTPLADDDAERPEVTATPHNTGSEPDVWWGEHGIDGVIWSDGPLCAMPRITRTS